MLQIMRDLTKSWIFKGLMMLLCISFGIWGIGDIFRGNPQQRAVGKVGSVVITVQALEQAFQMALPEARRIAGPDLTTQQARQLGVLDGTLHTMLEHASFNQEARRLGFDVGDQAILNRVAAMPHLRDKNGRFNTQLWHQALGKAGFTERGFLDNEREDSARHLIFDVLTNKDSTPQTLLDNLYRARGAKRVLEVLTLQNDSMTGIPAPDDKTLNEFYKQHGDFFTAPEYRTITIAKLSTDDVTKDIVIGDDDLRKAYDARPADVTLPEQRDLVQVVLQDEAKAKDVAEAAKANHNLSAAAKAKGLTPVALDHVDEKSILPELYTTVFALDEGQVSAPVKSPLGWHVMQMKKIHAGGKLSFDEAKAKLRETIQREQSVDTVTRIVNQLDDALAGGRALEDIADSMRLRLIKIPALRADGKTPEGKDPAEFPAKDDVMKTAFGQAAGETSSVIDDKNGNYIVVRTDEITPSQVRPYDQVKDIVVEAWVEQQKSDLAAKEAEDIAKALRDGKEMSSYAMRPGIEVRLSKPISMLGESDRALPPEALPEILKMKKGDVITGSGPDRHFVLRLASIIAVDPAKPDAARMKIADDLKDKFQYELIEEYANWLHQRFPVTVNQDLLETLKKQGS
jgi:peptidyl-prolyl cis-trans isomerase D